MNRRAAPPVIPGERTEGLPMRTTGHVALAIRVVGPDGGRITASDEDPQPGPGFSY